MGVNARKFSPGLFGAALLMFLMPFATYSCMGTRLAKMSGVKMVTGGTMELPKEFKELAKADTSTASKPAEKIPGNKLAMLALAATVVGLGVSFSKQHRTARLGGITAGAVGAVSLLVMKMGIESELKSKGAEQQMPGLLTVDFSPWFWLAVLLLAAAAVINFLALREDDRPAYAGAGTAPPYSPPPPSSYTPPAASPYAPPASHAPPADDDTIAYPPPAPEAAPYSPPPAPPTPESAPYSPPPAPPAPEPPADERPGDPFPGTPPERP